MRNSNQIVRSNYSYPYNDSATSHKVYHNLVAISCALDRDIYLTANRINFGTANHSIYRLEGLPIASCGEWVFTSANYLLTA